MISAIRYEAFSPTQRGGHTEGFADYLNEDVSLWWLTSSGKTATEKRWLPQSASSRTWARSMTGSPVTVTTSLNLRKGFCDTWYKPFWHPLAVVSLMHISGGLVVCAGGSLPDTACHGYFPGPRTMWDLCWRENGRQGCQHLAATKQLGSLWRKLQ